MLGYYGGENLSVGKIEKAILGIKGVAQAVVVGGKDEKFGEVPACMVIVKKGCTLSVEAIINRLSATLSKHEIPSHIKIVQSFPLLSSGKPDKQAVKKAFNY